MFSFFAITIGLYFIMAYIRKKFFLFSQEIAQSLLYMISKLNKRKFKIYIVIYL